MTTLAASKARIPPDAFNRVVYKGERLRIKHRSGATAVLISEVELERIERLGREEEDRDDLELIREAKSESGRSVPYNKVRKELGL
jgi:hypothetical protein